MQDLNLLESSCWMLLQDILLMICRWMSCRLSEHSCPMHVVKQLLQSSSSIYRDTHIYKQSYDRKRQSLKLSLDRWSWPNFPIYPLPLTKNEPTKHCMYTRWGNAWAMIYIYLYIHIRIYLYIHCRLGLC